MIRIVLTWMALCALGLHEARAMPPQDPPKPAPQAPDAPKPALKLTAWPKPENKDKLMTDIERVCKAHTPEMGDQGRDALIEVGAAAVPFVLDRYGHEHEEAARDRLHEVLIGITNATQTRLLAKEFENKLVLVRTFALWRAAHFPDGDLRAPAEAAYARVVKQGDKADPEERYAAALCTAAAGSVVGFDALYDATLKQWDKRKDELRSALNGCRGPQAATLALGKLDDKADRKVKVAVLRMLAGCGDKASAQRLRLMLDDEDNSIRVAAINALRGMVNNEGPLEGLSAFEAIEMAKQWKGKI